MQGKCHEEAWTAAILPSAIYLSSIMRTIVQAGSAAPGREKLFRRVHQIHQSAISY